MNIADHYKALYEASRSAMDAADLHDVELLHIYSGDTQTGQQVDPPFVIYRQDVERPIGSTGGGAAKVLRSSFVFTAYAVDLSEALEALSTIATALMVSDLTTDDGYVTTHIQVEGIQSLYENESHLYACHLRIFWERSA